MNKNKMAWRKERKERKEAKDKRRAVMTILAIQRNFS